VSEREVGGGDLARYGSVPNPFAFLSSSLILTQGILCTHKTVDITSIVGVMFVLICRQICMILLTEK
jgi:hypothetical protein